MEKSLQTAKLDLIAEIDRRVEDKILEQSNADLLKKLIINAETLTEAISIAELGTTYKRTGLHFDKRLEKFGNAIKYFQKNEALSFSTDSSKPTHKLIIGDNYDALLNLLVEYRGQIDVIYIDPPYGKDSMGAFATTNYENALTRDNLLSMLYPRLLLAKQLLSDSGIVFCSIDDKNQAYVKCLFDEVFHEKNSSGMFIWQKKKKPSFLSKNFGSMHEYVLCYVKDIEYAFPFSVDTTTAGKKYPFNNAGNGRAKLKFPPHSVSFNLPDGIVSAQNMSEGKIYTVLLNDVLIKDGKNENEFTLDGEWRYSQAKLDEIVANKESIIVSKIPFRPNHVKDGGEIKKMSNLLSPDSYECETNEDATKEMIEILGFDVFDNPKPVGLIQLLLRATTYEKKDAIVLDFFAGSGTTGQAVLELNNVDGGNRKFILCQINEITDKTPNGIAYDVTTKRLKRTMTGSCYDGSTNFKWLDSHKALGGNLEVFEIESVANFEKTTGKTPFDVIDETLYGRQKFTTIREKIEWVCGNFEGTQKIIENDEEWLKRMEENK